MTTKYKTGSEVPTDVLCKRLKELSDEITKGQLREFVMRIPAECDYCPDLVLAEAARRLLALTQKIEKR